MKKILSLIIIVSTILSASAFTVYAANEVTINPEIVYQNNKNITVYANASGEPSEFGIILNEDEENTSPLYEDSTVFRCYSKNSQGDFGIELTDAEVRGDSVFVIRGYAIYGSEISYSKSLVINKEEYYGRIPLLNSIKLSEGELYPVFSEDVFEYYILVEEPSIPEITYEKKVSDDKDSYTKGETAKIELDSGFSKSEYTFKTRLNKQAVLPANKFMTKEYSAVSSLVADITPKDVISITSEQYAYFDFDKRSLPEKFVPTKIETNLPEGITAYKCTEPNWSSKPAGSFPLYYYPQNEKVVKEGNILNEKQFKSKTDLSIMVKNVSASFSDLKLNVTYFEDIPLPLTKEDSSSSELIALSAEGANQIYPIFSKNTYEYYALYDNLPEAVPKILPVTEDKDAKVTVTTSEDTAKIKVTSEDGSNSETYTVIFREYKTASMKLSKAGAKRMHYEMFYRTTPEKKAPDAYFGRLSNKSGTYWTHLGAMAFDTSEVTDTDIKITSAELTIFANTNNADGIYINIYRSRNTDWPTTTKGRNAYTLPVHASPMGYEGVLNDKTLITRASSYNSAAKDYRYYTIPLKTEGFTDAKSINLYYLPEWYDNGKTNDQYAYLWLGSNSLESENGRGMLPTVNIKYFVK